MTKSDTPKDGDFASYVQGMQSGSSRPSENGAENLGATGEPKRQSIEKVLLEGEEPTDEFLEEWNALENAPPLSEEELARQALDAPGDDGDPNTPE